MPKKQLSGAIVSSKMQKTVVVEVERVYKHPKYKKIFKLHKKYKAHSDHECQTGDRVIIEECRPLSKDKKWRVVKNFNMNNKDR